MVRLFVPQFNRNTEFHNVHVHVHVHSVFLLFSQRKTIKIGCWCYQQQITMYDGNGGYRSIVHFLDSTGAQLHLHDSSPFEIEADPRLLLHTRMILAFLGKILFSFSNFYFWWAFSCYRRAVLALETLTWVFVMKLKLVWFFFFSSSFYLPSWVYW